MNTNAKRNPLRMDPTRTTMLRKQFVTQMNKRFGKLRGRVMEKLWEEDALGLRPEVGRSLPQVWRFQTNPQKIVSFREWLQGQVDQGILEVADPTQAWSSDYVQSAYKKGIVRAYTDLRKEDLIDDSVKSTAFFNGKKAQFLESALAAPETTQKLELLYARSFTGLEGITQTMDTTMSRVLADGLSNGLNPRVIARNLNKEVEKLTKTRARTLARTEVVHAHAEGQLDSYEKLGVENLGVMAEWSTAGDDLVCPLCLPLEAQVFTQKQARGILPRHPSCRCTWMPANVGEVRKKPISLRETKSAVRDSIKKEGKGTLKERANKTRWAGVEHIQGATPKKPKSPAYKDTTTK